MHEVVDDLTQLPDRPALPDEVARGRVKRHHAVPDAPAPLALRVQPDDPLHALALERPLDGALDRIRAEGLGDLGDLGDEHVRADPAEALLEAPDELQHEARGVTDRIRHVADRDELRLFAVPSLEEDLHRYPAVLEALPRRPPRVQAPLVLLPLAQRERILDLARQPRDHALHLGDLVRRQGEKRLVRENLARELLALAVRSTLQLALDVLADHPLEGLEPQLEVIADPRQLARVETARLERLHDPLEVALDGGPVEAVRDPA